jgi:hypothetical protein
MRHLIKILACWLLAVVLPIQALAGVVRFPEAPAGGHHPVGQTDHQSDCPHHRATAPCIDCISHTDLSSDRGEFPDSSRCNACSFCCMLLLPVAWSLLIPGTSSASPAQAESRFRSIALRGLERPPRAPLLLPA